MLRCPRFPRRRPALGSSRPSLSSVDRSAGAEHGLAVIADVDQDPLVEAGQALVGVAVVGGHGLLGVEARLSGIHSACRSVFFSAKTVIRPPLRCSTMKKAPPATNTGISAARPGFSSGLARLTISPK